jgi:hypothetical protein
VTSTFYKIYQGCLRRSSHKFKTAIPVTICISYELGRRGETDAGRADYAAFCISAFISSEPNQVRALGGSDAVSLKESWARPCGGLNEWALVLLD